MNKDELADSFDTGLVNIVVQCYEHGTAGNLHKDLEERNEFGKSNKTPEEATDYQLKCINKGINRFVVIYETDRLAKETKQPAERIRHAFTNRLYDYIKDYLGIARDTDGEKIETVPGENQKNYVFKVLERTTLMGQTKIVVHAPVEMNQEETQEFYSYMQRTAQQYKNTRFLVLDQKERGIDNLDSFEVMRWK